ncbi:HK97 gp10 family phage protein [Cohaesibacter marisflavi]|uniref:HK97 gp10 family phage protein n=1 Tax=Cohaesibacter marisflavi TaxID=655353 RepID=UPI0029C8475E|nr:HK97 gp10 family phage protein [Cohaesibacter marisflavi]
MAKTRWIGKEKAFGKLKSLAPAIEKDLSPSLEKSADELAGLARRYAPKKSGDYARSIEADQIKEDKQTPAWGLFADFIWRFIEFGTKPGRYGARTSSGGRDRKVYRTHPGTAARPHIWPAYRIVQRRIKSRTSRTINKAIKTVGRR